VKSKPSRRPGRRVARGARLLGVQLVGLMVEQRAVEYRMRQRALAQEGREMKRVTLAGIGLQVAAVVPPLGELVMRGIVRRQLDRRHPGGGVEPLLMPSVRLTSAAGGATGGLSERKKSSQATANIMISQPQITSQR
jgi:hypothetical protein